MLISHYSLKGALSDYECFFAPILAEFWHVLFPILPTLLSCEKSFNFIDLPRIKQPLPFPKRVQSSSFKV